MAKNNNSNNDTLKPGDKIIIFFGGVFIVLFAGYHTLFNYHGKAETDKVLIIKLYYGGILFWILLITSLYYLSLSN
ncbi:hypothetical protein [Winogradskyella pelagia]|uniref:hypothetical protein n=1 Tax=Winogradskyella pelagia TaxID=2819984 RepID=UPI001FB87510|nr:hypothetical protein [Winogradskyella sp. DF17]